MHNPFFTQFQTFRWVTSVDVLYKQWGEKKRKTLPAFVVLSFFILTGGFTDRPVEPFSPDVTSYEGNPPPAQQKEFEVRQKKRHYLRDIFWSINTQTPLDLDSFMKELNTRPLKVKKLLYIKVSNSGPRPKTTSCSYHQIKHEIILKNFPKINWRQQYLNIRFLFYPKTVKIILVNVIHLGFTTHFLSSAFLSLV